jgi:RNA polymerase sigma-70 factor (ECF subfamily)
MAPHRMPPTGDGQWEELMAASMVGDARAYDRLLRQVLPYLRAISRRRIADPAEAEDAVQDALLTIHRLRHSYDPTRPLRPWIAALCERRCIDRLRARRRHAERCTALETLDTAALPADPSPDATSMLLRAEVRSVVQRLPAAQRIAVTLVSLHGLPFAEAAARSGGSIGALKVAAHRAVRRLRLELLANDPVASSG